MNSRRGSWTLIEILVVAVILIALAAWLLPRYLGSGQSAPGQPTVQAPVQRAQGVECMNNLRSVRQALTMAQQTEERPPASLTEIRLPQQLYACPVSKQPYVYDPRTGRVGCPYPPHRSF
jgi:type II secretory pathway pseudopilin PulG